MKTTMARMAILLPILLLSGGVAGAEGSGSIWPGVDLRPVADQARVEAVAANVTPTDRALLDIIGSDAGQVAARHPDFLWVAAKPLPPPTTEPAATTTRDAAPILRPDVVVEVTFRNSSATDIDALLRDVVQRLGSAWYSQAAMRLDVPGATLAPDPGLWAGVPPQEPVRVARVGVVLVADAKPAPYWRIAIPVDTASIGLAWLDLLMPIAPAIGTVAVEFVHVNAVTDVREAFVDFIRPLPGLLAGPTLAVGYVPRHERAGDALVRVDPLNRIAETDEKNNNAMVRLEPPPPAVADLTFVPDSSRIRETLIKATVEDPDLPFLIADDARKVAHALGIAAKVSVSSAWHILPMMSAADATRSLRPNPLQELVVAIQLPGAAQGADRLAAETTAALSRRWYATAAEVLPELQSTAVLPPPTTIRIAVKLAGPDVTRHCWQIEVAAVCSLRPSVNRVSEPDALRIVEVGARFADENDVGYAAVGTVTLPSNGVERALVFADVQAPAQRLTGVLTVDPANEVAEGDETNNTTAFTWERPQPPRPEEDVTAVGDGIRDRVVGCTASARDPVLLEVVRRTAVHAVADLPGFCDVHVFPWTPKMAGLTHLLSFPEGTEFDVVLVGLFTPGPAAREDPTQRWLAAFGGAWYVQSVVPAAALEQWSALEQAMPIYAPRQRAVALIRLAQTAETRKYWRIAVPVVRDDVHQPLPANAVTLPRYGWLDAVNQLQALLAQRETAGDPGLPAPVPRPVLTAVEFTAEFATATGTAATGNGWDHVWLAPNAHALAVGFVELAGKPTAGALTVDAGDAIPEADETNNRYVFAPTPEPPPQSRFHAWARLRGEPDATVPRDAAAETLVVGGVLSNPTDQPLTLRFPSTLQLDYRVGDFYQWSDGRAFAQVVTETVVGPGSAVSWVLETPLAETGWDGTPTTIAAFLAGTDYRATVPFPAPSPGPVPEPAPEPPPPPDNSLIVGPDGASLDDVIAELRQDGSTGPVALETIAEPLEGNLAEGIRTLLYQGLQGFQGEDYMILGTGEGAQSLQRLKVGLQAFRMSLQQGWNLVSFPIKPVEPLDELLARIPGGSAWSWQDGVYRAPLGATVGEGLWLYSAVAMTLEYVGEPVPKTELALRRGWNLVGTVNRTGLARLPGVLAARGWDSARGDYVEKPALQSGEGNWVYVPTPCWIPIN